MMTTNDLLETLRGGLIVSCQAYAGEPLYGPDTMAKLAQAAQLGGAVGIRANSPADIQAIKQRLTLPVIGIWKERYEDSAIYITPTLREAVAVAQAGADIVALDATPRRRPGDERLPDMIKHLRSHYSGCLLMADVSTVDEGLQAEQLGFDIVSTTLSGYTEYSVQQKEPDLELVRELAGRLSVPVFAEGRIASPAQAAECIKLGAHAVVVGSAITRPELLTRKFAEGLAPLPKLVGKD